MFQPLDLLALAFQLGFIFVDLPLRLFLLHLPALELIANQRACTEAKHAADGATCRGATQGADPCAFLPGRQQR